MIELETERSAFRHAAVDKDLILAADALHEQVCAAQRELLRTIRELDRREAWQDTGARDLAHWLCMRYGISSWKARRWIQAAQALEQLPRLSRAFASGALGIDKVVELCRFATPETEGRLIRWAKDLSCATIRRRGDVATRASAEEIVESERSRSLTWWYIDEGRRLGLEAELPAAQGEIVVRAIERMSERIPVMPGEAGRSHVDARRADALVALSSARIAADPDPDRATVVVHAPLATLKDSPAGSELGGGSGIPNTVFERLLCNARTQIQVENEAGDVDGLGRMSREPPAWMIRQVRYRDRGCRFPGCGTRAFTEAHHVRWWRTGGRTSLDNLLLICSFHHRLVHELGWSVHREPDGSVRWSHPDGSRYRAGPPEGPARADRRSIEPRAAGEDEAEPVGQDREPFFGCRDRPAFFGAVGALDPELVRDHHPSLVDA
jgi:uncharacterized protein DUF222